ncbi:hypothetical protein Hsw_0643 [Hymenobacter swuensis DY53]|uniref:Uncharacterized protein n=1 Tax=Hymenobacter swuensis DY53 TaxID=1227739 RepID=W8EUM5_9BACT|nr:hypothetical protein Hsw_0643 [Hymenobacter swuensis DY53]
MLNRHLKTPLHGGNRTVKYSESLHQIRVFCFTACFPVLRKAGCKAENPDLVQK